MLLPLSMHCTTCTALQTLKRAEENWRVVDLLKKGGLDLAYHAKTFCYHLLIAYHLGFKEAFKKRERILMAPVEKSYSDYQ